MTQQDTITGLILAGGRATRMGEVDKGLQRLAGLPLAAHVLARLAPQVAQVAISANRHADIWAGFGLPVWPDDTRGHAGPLAGIEAALRRAATPLLLCVPCDTPALPHDLAARLRAALDAAGADVAYAVTGDGPARQIHPVVCLMRTSLRTALSAWLAAGGRRVEAWFGEQRAVAVPFADAAAFDNINTRAQLQAAEQALAAPPAPAVLSVRDAQQRIAAAIAPRHDAETVTLDAALGRVLAADVISPIDVPAHDNAAMDGYALPGAALPAAAPRTLRVAGAVYAGHPATAAPAADACLRIMTGAVMPPGCDTVIPQELVSERDGAIVIAPGTVLPGAHRRRAGEDLRAGQPALTQGRVLHPADLGLLASLGIGAVTVRRRLTVAVFSTGDELRAPGEALVPGAIYDSNRYAITAMLRRLGCAVCDLGLVRDEPQALAATLRRACVQADVVITSGGVSEGAADHTRQVLATMGEVAFWKLALRPGRPLAFGRIAADGHDALLFGLPGNPVAAMVSFYCFVRAALLDLMGADAPLPLMKARAAGALRKRPGRVEFQRAIVGPGADGWPEVRSTGAQGSGMLSSMSQANCLVVLDEARGDVAAGDAVDVLLFDGLA